MPNDMKCEISIILLCGVPASGKSTLLRSFEKRMKNWREERYLDTENGKNRSWQIEQWDEVFAEKWRVDMDEEGIKDSELQEIDTFDPVQYKNLRKEWLQQLKDRICRANATNTPLHLIIEDNFYLNSMRREIYLVCEVIGAAYGEVILKCSLEACLERNEHRDAPIPHEIIERMHALFEYDSRNHEMMQRHLELDTEVMSTEDCFVSTVEFIQSLGPVHSEKLIREDQKQRSRQQNLENVRHQMDLLLKKRTGHLLGNLRKTSAKQPNAIAKELGALRKEFISLHANVCEGMLRDQGDIPRIHQSSRTPQYSALPESIQSHFVSLFDTFISTNLS